MVPKPLGVDRVTNPVQLTVLHADNHLLVVDKPAGLPVVPDSSGDRSLLDLAKAWVAKQYNKPGAVFLGVVHRLDRPVSGVVCFARTSKAASRLSEEFRNHGVEKLYWALSDSVPGGTGGELVQWLVKDREKNRVRVVESSSAKRLGAKEARTLWRLLSVTALASGPRVHLELIPKTGRSHQLRVAAASLGSPLLGDLKYGAATPLEDKSVALHARCLTLTHPTKRERMTFTCQPPALQVWQ